jgi:prepilin-type N-terminal cleavage/methylation domain-containing protein
VSRAFGQRVTPNQQSGYTLVEVVVVLVLLAIAATVVAPSLLAPRRMQQSSSLVTVVATVREAAVRRGEMVRFRVDRSGAWQALAGVPPDSELLLSGRLSTLGHSTADILFSPLGTCAPSPESIAPEALVGIDPLTCQAAVE